MQILHKNKWLLALLLMVGNPLSPIFAQESQQSVETGGHGVEETNLIGENTEQQLDPSGEFAQWRKKFADDDGEVEKGIQKVLEKKVTTKKLKGLVPPIRFKSGKADIPEEFIDKLREILHSMKDRINVRLHFIGHTDNVKLRGRAMDKYKDNMGLSRERAGTTAEYFQRALGLPPEAISYEGLGETKPVADNSTAAGKAQNRRVEVQVWYDEVEEVSVDREVELDQKIKRIQVCRVETVCKIRYKVGHSKRAKLKNLVQPFPYEADEFTIPEQYVKQLRQALHNLRDKENVKMRFIAHTDNVPLMGREARIYGDHVGLSKSRARRFAVAVQEVMKLPSSAVDSDGKGTGAPIASNNSERGRALNRRIEVEFWHDDPLEELPDEPQICPEADAAETVERIYNPPEGEIKAVVFEKGQPVFPVGYTRRLARAMEDIKDKGNVRLRFIGYISNERLDRRTAMVYGDDIGLSTARARRVMDSVKQEMQLKDKQAEFEGRGYVQSSDVANTGFVEMEESRVEVRIVYDELAYLDDSEGLEIKRLTRAVQPKNPYELNLMRISVDGQPINDPNKNIPDVQRCTDVALDKAKIQFKFDNLSVKPRLNVTAWPNVISLLDKAATEIRENQVDFALYSNYPSFITSAEVRIFYSSQSVGDTPAYIVPLDTDGRGFWRLNPEDLLNRYSTPGITLKYVLRVYNKDKQFDETAEQSIRVVDKLQTDISVVDKQEQMLLGYGENRLARNNIPLQGASVWARGQHIPPGHKVWFAGNEIPVSQDGQFISELILPQGLHSVEVAVTDGNGNGDVYLREVQLGQKDWFYVGIADVTLSRDQTNGPAALATGDQSHYDNDLSVDGRLAFYTRGRFQNGWSLKASADTREGPLEDLFNNFMNKSPDSVFRRINPDYYYPTYGDDSSVEEDAPTSGKFYTKLYKNKDHVLWGNFSIDYTDNNLAHVDRRLYGFNTHFESDSTTSFGERRYSWDVFAAQPGTVAGRDEFRGTGGSLYFLQHQDLMSGSERARIEVRDALSGMVLSVKNLAYGLDYTVDYIQGRVMLNQALSPSSDNGMLIDTGDFSGSHQYLIVRYEYTPGFDDMNDLAMGGRAHYWMGDTLKLGITADKNDISASKSTLNAMDVMFRMSPGTWIKYEYSISKGAVATAALSADGGFDFQSVNNNGFSDSANGQRLDAAVRVQEFIPGLEGSLNYYRQDLEAGYAAPGIITNKSTIQTGGSLELPFDAYTKIKVKSDAKVQKDGLETRASELNLDRKIDAYWNMSFAVRADERSDNSPVVPATQKEGKRNDAALKLGFDSNANWSAYGYYQETLQIIGTRERNTRVGVGGDYRSGDRLTFNSELSTGHLGHGATLGADYKMTDTTNIYSSYTLENERSDNGVRARKGNMASGFKTRYSDSSSIYLEEKYSHGDTPTGLTHSMGFDLAPTDSWNFGASLDSGKLRDSNTGAEIERNAMGLSLGYKMDLITYAGAIEYRRDETQQPNLSLSTRTTWLAKNSFKYTMSADWNFLGKLNYSFSESSMGEFYDGNFTEAVFGYAYRPVAGSGLNALFKFTHFYNVPATDQVTINNTAAEYIQKSDILSLDFSYDLSRSLGIGAKYAYRYGQISQDRVNPVFFRSDAALYILRLDWHLTHSWDALLEERLLELPQVGDRRHGILAGLYRHVNEFVKLGVGYNFTDFSDDLTDLDFDSQGFFINIVGKF